MTDFPDYYKILSVPPTASRGEIRAAFRRLAQRHHPDVNPPGEDDIAANEFMRRLNEAYEVLNDPRRRATYDRQRWALASPPQPKAPQPSTPSWSPTDDAHHRAQTGGGRWRESRSRRVVYEQPMPGWAQSLFAIGQHLRMRLEPVWTIVGVMVPALVASVLLVLGFFAYEGVAADPDSVAFLECIVGAAGGPWVIVGVFGVIFLIFLVAWFAVWKAFKGY